jgi:leader peptidase (prepilin peptidase)/N-methyltransferase
VSTSSVAHLPWWALAVLAVVGAGLGQLTARELATGGYRIEDDEVRGPAGRMWWPAPTLALLWFVVGWYVGDRAEWAAVPAYLLFGWLSVALIWIDFDVHRLPVGLVRPGSGGVVLLLAVASVADGGSRWRGALIGMVVVWLVFYALSWLPGGGMGWGDVRLSPVVGLLLGWLGWRYLQAGLIATFAVGGLIALVALLRGRNRKAFIAYGPAMCLGVFVGVGWASQIMVPATSR